MLWKCYKHPERQGVSNESTVAKFLGITSSKHVLPSESNDIDKRPENVGQLASFDKAACKKLLLLRLLLYAAQLAVSFMSSTAFGHKLACNMCSSLTIVCLHFCLTYCSAERAVLGASLCHSRALA